ncbi:hypothetical protein D9615_009004 [Tricholomella constricta]|uniref:Uncharacterized protein n=1 Tax=Tricholomella constricta TaxID=117010 RepID=A0A8H5H0X0_9AGAR|nr:hypothetical protein D9615_009004 [Tricholomella constricta]
MIDSLRDYKEIARLHTDTDPRIGRRFLESTNKSVFKGREQDIGHTSDVEKSTAGQDIADLLVLVHVSAKTTNAQNPPTAAVI